MTTTTTTLLRPFNPLHKLVHRQRSAVHSIEFIRDATASMLVDRLEHDMTHTFSTMVDLGFHHGAIWRELNSRGERIRSQLKQIILVDNVPSSSSSLHSSAIIKDAQIQNINARVITDMNADWTNICPQILPRASTDLIISNCLLHQVNDLPGVFKQIRNALRPDGAFLGCLLAGETLFELRNALAMAQQEREGGLSPHVSPTIRPADVCGLLSGAGLNLATVDTSVIEVEYNSIYSCMRDLWWMGESFAPAHGPSRISRETFMAAGVIAGKLFGVVDANKTTFPVTFEVVSMIGWGPSETQPKPLKPSIPQVSLRKLGQSGGEG